jgi:hypothetical protein
MGKPTPGQPAWAELPVALGWMPGACAQPPRCSGARTGPHRPGRAGVGNGSAAVLPRWLLPCYRDRAEEGLWLPPRLSRRLGQRLLLQRAALLALNALETLSRHHQRSGAAGAACCSCYAEQAALCQAVNQQHWCKACRTRTAAPLPDHCPPPPRRYLSHQHAAKRGACVMHGPQVQHTRRPPGGEGACRAAVHARDVLCHPAGCRPWTEGHGGDKALPLAIACLDSQAPCRSGQRYRGQQGAGISRCCQF